MTTLFGSAIPCRIGIHYVVGHEAAQHPALPEVGRSRMIADVTDIPRSSVHRAMGAIARAEAKKQVAIAGLVEELLGKKLSRRGRGQ
jgi:hypothetical protein